EFEQTNQSLKSYKKKFVNNFYFENIEYKMFDSLKEVNNFIENTYKYVLHHGLDKKERLKKTEKELLNS
ncbi:TPA: hypothetical protein KM222_001739, partial [Staphylococcus aureus]|nr:hypothetical protein [Staphylococcus aureus]